MKIAFGRAHSSADREWHTWYAWRPVIAFRYPLTPCDGVIWICWLCRVERKWYGDWMYRLL